MEHVENRLMTILGAQVPAVCGFLSLALGFAETTLDGEVDRTARIGPGRDERLAGSPIPAAA